MKKFLHIMCIMLLLVLVLIPQSVFAEPAKFHSDNNRITASIHHKTYSDLYHLTKGPSDSIYLESGYITPNDDSWTAEDSGVTADNIYGIVFDGDTRKYYNFRHLSDQSSRGWYCRKPKNSTKMVFDDYVMTGYVFQGFYTGNFGVDKVSDSKPSGAGKKVVDADRSFCFKEDTGLHEAKSRAWFKERHYKVIIDTGIGDFKKSHKDYYDGKGFGSSNKYSKSIKYTAMFNLKKPKLSSWTFEGWNTTTSSGCKAGTGLAALPRSFDELSDLSQLLQSGTITFTGTWSSVLGYDLYDISWSQNPSFSPGSPTFNILRATGSTIDKVKAGSAIMTGYIFDGWSRTTGDDAVRAVKPNKKFRPTKSDGNGKMYAMWTPITYSVNYNVGLTNHTENCPGSQQHTFDITYDNAESKGFHKDSYKIVNGDKLVGRDYTIYFNTNIPSTCSTAASFSANGASLNPITGRLESAGATNRWRCRESGVYYSDGQTASVCNLCTTNNGSVTMEARWNSKNVSGFPTGLTMDGYEFKGWATSPTSKVPVSYVTVDPATTAYTGTLYAIWEPLPYWVKYYPKDGGSGSVITEEWKFDTPHPLFNNTPNLSGTPATANSGATPHFTKLGNYVSSWSVGSITGTRNAAKDRTGAITTGTAYTPQETSYSVTRNETNLCTPRAKDCVVNLYTDWTNLKYKIQYFNDTSVPSGPDRGYKFSSATYTTPSYNFDQNVTPWVNNFTRENKYGRSTFLGYCHVNGDTYLSPKVVVPGQSPEDYLLKANPTGQLDMRAPTNVITHAIWSRNNNNAPDKSFDYIINKTFNRNEHTKCVTTSNVPYGNYFAYMNQGAVQVFPLYAVWDDCPGCEPEDLEQELGAAVKQFNLCTQGIGSRVVSKKDLEWYILKANAGTVWDREQTDLTAYLDSDDPCPNPGYYIDSFANTNISAADPIASYELRYTVKDRSGNKYQTSRKLYGGNFVDIMLHENVHKLKR